MQTTREIQNGCPNQASRSEMANKPKIERTHGEKEGEKRDKTTTLSEKEEEASNVS